MIRRPPRATRTDTLLPYTTLFRSRAISASMQAIIAASIPSDQFSKQDVKAMTRREFAKGAAGATAGILARSAEHTSELQTLMRTLSAVFCLKQNSIPYIFHFHSHGTMIANATQSRTHQVEHR